MLDIRSKDHLLDGEKENVEDEEEDEKEESKPLGP